MLSQMGYHCSKKSLLVCRWQQIAQALKDRIAARNVFDSSGVSPSLATFSYPFDAEFPQLGDGGDGDPQLDETAFLMSDGGSVVNPSLIEGRGSYKRFPVGVYVVQITSTDTKGLPGNTIIGMFQMQPVFSCVRKCVCFAACD
jgi:hypothetical protein